VKINRWNFPVAVTAQCGFVLLSLINIHHWL